MTRMSRGAPGLAVPLRAERGLAVFAERLQPVRDMRVDAEEPVVLPVVLVPVLQVQVVPERVLQVSVVPVPVVLVPVLVPVRHQSEAALGRPDLPRAYVGPAARIPGDHDASGGHALALADPEVARFLELIAAEGSGSEPLPRNPFVDERKDLAMHLVEDRRTQGDSKKKKT